MLFLLRPLRLLLKAILTESTPGQMSLGLSLGILLGLVPKGNLLAIGLGMLLASLRINLGVAAAAATTCTFAATWIDPISHRIGSYVLSHPSLQSLWTDLYNTPVVPWTSFNNSVVMGGFLLGVTLVWPIHRLTRPLFAEYMDMFAERARRWRITRLLLGAEWADRFGSVN